MVMEIIAMSSRMHTVMVMVARGITTGLQALSAHDICLPLALQVAVIENMGCIITAISKALRT